MCTFSKYWWLAQWERLLGGGGGGGDSAHVSYSSPPPSSLNRTLTSTPSLAGFQRVKETDKELTHRKIMTAMDKGEPYVEDHSHPCG